MTPEEKEHEMMRRELWIKVAVAVANCENAKLEDSPARWANETLKKFDEKFKALESNNIKD